MNGYTGVITDEEWENAVVFISGKMDDENIEKIKEDIKEQGESWWSIQHFGIGMDIRNMLRKGGFNWDDGAIDEFHDHFLWVWLVGIIWGIPNTAPSAHSSERKITPPPPRVRRASPGWPGGRIPSWGGSREGALGSARRRRIQGGPLPGASSVCRRQHRLSRSTGLPPASFHPWPGS